uniref:Deoxyhypusine hydroxylase n=1 Tax=Polytomella parva TaxID=51329 RepID=A0A7S0YGD3_9CHLO|mmetsp:Transcript_17369/g.31725  ORF Transcript_17369/g.31725 Transcript_17369/m.31725 type:complete len:332 (+) Transcript_17369:179-1174(+)
MVQLIEADVNVIADLRRKLISPDTKLSEKYRVLFSLRNVKNQEAQDALLEALKDNSALFRHDVAFCLGQRQDASSIATLTKILHDESEHAMVRHEAGEALGAIGTPECLEPLKEHEFDPVQEVAETCQLALQRIRYYEEHPEVTDSESPFYSVDPTPAYPVSTPVSELEAIYLDEKKSMFERYRALFSLRNKGPRDSAAVAALCRVFSSSSALLKHEVAYVMGQLLSAKTVSTLMDVLSDNSQHAMVRHEAAEALGAIADPKSIAMLETFAKDVEPIVADSCIVALDMLEFEQSGGFEYADKGGETQGEEKARDENKMTAAQMMCPCKWEK